MTTIENFMTRILMVTDFPFGKLEFYVDHDGNLHHDTKPALITPNKVTWFYHGRRHGTEIFRNGIRKYYYDGMLIPDTMNPFELSKKDIYKLREGFTE